MSLTLASDEQRAAIDPWRLFDLATLREQLPDDGVAYREFLRVPALHMALYRLPAGSKDMQTPHEEDEVYFVLEGRGRIQLGTGTDAATRSVTPGMVLHVQATEPHAFFEIEEDMLLLVLLATSAPSLRAQATEQTS